MESKAPFHWWARSIRPLWIAFLALVLATPATLYRDVFLQNGKRSWWYFRENDACQAVAAHALAQRMGSPNEYVIWPGVTLNTPYLYAFLAEKRPLPGNLSETVANLREAVFWHWKAAYLHQILAAWIFFAVLWLACRNLPWSFAGAFLITLHPWYAWETSNIRPETLSMLFVGISAGVILVAQADSRHIKILPLVAGFSMGLAVLTKIQTLPLVTVGVGMICAGRYPGARLGFFYGSDPTISPRVFTFPGCACSLLCGVFSMAFLKTPLIQGTSYQLPGKSAWPGCIATALILGLVLMQRRSFSPRIQLCLQNALGLLAGFFLSLLALTLPNLLFGGGMAWVTSVNRICFAIVSYPFSGLKWKNMDGWGEEVGLGQRLDAIWSLWLQSPGTVPLIAGLLFLAAVSFLLQKRKTVLAQGSTRLGIAWHDALPWMVGLAGLMMDWTSSQRLIGGSIYSYYSLYSYPLYIAAVVMQITQTLGCRFPKMVYGAGLVLGGFLVASLPAAVATAESRFFWNRPEDPPSAYRANLEIIRIVAPSFEKTTGVSVEEIGEAICQP